MNPENPMPEIDNSIPPNAVRIYNQDPIGDDFPVLKAFQQYIDAEQAKARKRLVTLGIFFGALTFAIIAVFVALLIGANERNQHLNDRLVEYAMKDRNRSAAVVVQPTTPQDSATVLKLTEKLETMQKQLMESEQAKLAAEKAVAEKAKPVPVKGPTADQVEIARLKALLAHEQQKVAEEKAKQRELELEAYRRKHYPELYERKAEPQQPVKKTEKKPARARTVEEIDDDELDAELDEAISYFKESDETPPKKDKKGNVESESTGRYTIPVEVKGTRLKWRVPQK